MSEQKKTMRPSRFAVAYAKPTDTLDLQLFDLDEFKKHKNEYTHCITDDFLLQKCIPVKQNFFYIAEQCDCAHHTRTVTFYEKGVGELYKKGRKFFLKRERATYFNDAGTGEYQAPPYSFHDFDKDSHIIIRSIIPDQYLELFAYPYSVLCCIEPYTPTPVELEESSVIGRLNDQVQSIDKDELRQILTDQNIVGAVQDNQDNLLLNSKIVDLVNRESRLSTPVIHIKAVHNNSQKPQKPVRGSLIFNDETGNFEGFNGNEWVPLQWGGA